MRRMCICVAFVVSSGMCGGGAQAAQQLLPTPYPEGLGTNAMGDPHAGTHYHQRLLPDAAPAAKGPNALGNPHMRHHRHQHLLRDPYPRQWWKR